MSQQSLLPLCLYIYLENATILIHTLARNLHYYFHLNSSDFVLILLPKRDKYYASCVPSERECIRTIVLVAILSARL